MKNCTNELVLTTPNSKGGSKQTEILNDLVEYTYAYSTTLPSSIPS